MSHSLKKDSSNLTHRQRRFVDTLVAEGGTYQEAALKAGYKDGPGLKVTAWRNLNLPHVQQYMQEQLAKTFGLRASKAAKQIEKLVDGAKSEYVRLEAAKDTLDRAGFKPVDRSQIQVAGDFRVSIDLS